MLERFERRDVRFIVGCLAVALVCGAIALRYFGRAFPEAAIQFAVNRTESAEVATRFLADVGLAARDYKHAVMFDYDEETKTFLERSLGLERAQQLYSKQIRLWRWSHRWFKPQQKEELRVDVTAGGEIARFTHLLPEEAPGAELAPDSARALAEQFLVRHMHVRLAEWEFVEGSSTQQPHRVDHAFTWKKKNFDAVDPDASYRMTATVAGDAMTGYDEFLDIPQAWQDEYATLRAHNETAAIVALVCLVLTWLAMVGSVVLRIRDHAVRWRIVMAFGIVAFALQLLSALNQFDLDKFGYETQDSYASFVTEFLLQSLLGALASGAAIAILTAAAEPIYRERYANKLSLTALFSRRGMRTKRFFHEMLLGLTLMLFFAAYQSLFYVVAARFGAWAPLEVPYNNLLTTAIPWALVLFIGFMPAVSEEFTSRMFSVPFLDKHLSRLGLSGRVAVVVAVVLASYVWGFAHSNYANQPFWIRGIEVGTAGVLVSYVMLRWGILATLVWHYTVDAFYTSLLMLRSGNSYFVVSGSITAGIMLVPLVVCLILYRRRGGFEPETGLRNGDDPIVSLAAPRSDALGVAPARVQIAPVPTRRFVVGAVVGAALLLLYLVPAVEPGEGIALETRRAQAVESARTHLQELGGDPARYRSGAQMASRYESDAGRYVLEHTSLEKLNEIYTTRIRTPVWRVRFYQPEQREEWWINLPIDEMGSGAPDSGSAPGGADPGHAAAFPPSAAGIPLWAFQHVIPDSTPGDTLSVEAAQILASDFLRSRGIEPADLELKESHSERRKERTDHTFEWEVPDSTLGEAGIRYLVAVNGGDIVGLRPYLHLPEAWKRDYDKRSALQQVLWVLSQGVNAAVLVGIVVLFVIQVRARRFPWKVALGWGAAAGVLSLVLFGLRWGSDILMRYDTTTPYRLFLVSAAASTVIPFLLIGIPVTVLVGTTFALRPQSRALFTGGYDARACRDALGLALLGIVLQVGLQRFGVVLTDYASRFATVEELFMLAPAARPMPWLDVFVDQVCKALLRLPAAALVLSFLVPWFGIRRALLFVVLAVLLFAGEDARTWGEFGFQLAIGGATAALLLFVIGYLFRGHDLAYVLGFVGARGLGEAATWLEQPESTARVTGAIVAALFALLLAAIVWCAGRRRERRSEGGLVA